MGQGEAQLARARPYYQDDTSKAVSPPGFKSVVTGAEFPDIPTEEAFMGEGPVNFSDQA
jgi:hypothetical protein